MGGSVGEGVGQVAETESTLALAEKDVCLIVLGDERGLEADREGATRRDHQHEARVRSHELLCRTR